MNREPTEVELAELAAMFDFAKRSGNKVPLSVLVEWTLRTQGLPSTARNRRDAAEQWKAEIAARTEPM